MDPRPAALVLDDGELGDVRATLEQIGVEYTYLRGGAADGIDVEPPRQLLVATPRRALGLRGAAGKPDPDGDRAVRIAVTEQDSVALRDQLRGVGFDYLVRRPIHPGALRLLLLRALYRGPERRVTVRYPIGGEVAYKLGLRRRRATLLEVSLRGCRLQAESPAESDARISVVLPKEFTGTKSVSLPGWVVRCEPDVEGSHEIAVAFEALSNRVERSLRTVLKRKIQGLDPDGGTPLTELSDRREGGRRTFQGEVRLQDRAARALVGRDLSTGGMLVEQNLDLRLGDTPLLEIFGRDGDELVRVQARVVRDDENGMALQFVDVPAAAAERLEAMVAGLPAVERLADTEVEAMGTVVAEIVDEA